MPASEEEEPTYIECYNCGDTMEEDDTYTNDWDINRRCCGCNEDYVCEMEELQNEDEDDSLIMSYSCKPTAIFLNDDGHKSYYATVIDQETSLNREVFRARS